MVMHWRCAGAETHLGSGLRAVNFRDLYGSGGNKSGGDGGTRAERSAGALRMEYKSRDVQDARHARNSAAHLRMRSWVSQEPCSPLIAWRERKP